MLAGAHSGAAHGAAATSGAGGFGPLVATESGFGAGPRLMRSSLACGLRDGPRVGRARVRFGEIGEELAVQELERQGYAILARRYRRRGGEIDIVAADGVAIVFVEVKARDGGAFGRGAEAITALKRHRLTGTARDFLARHRLQDRPCRFDVVAIDIANGSPHLEVIRNAFDATG